ncbi:MAG TPA: matrixin family metalloprotease [Polyangiales bacterium]|nr:matrixin family metalloprotease [Polyangiales bacterium]
MDTVAFRMDPELVAVLPDGDIMAATNMAFDAWRGLPRVPDLMLRPGLPETPGHHDDGPTNGLYLIRDWQGKPDQLAVTVVTYSGDTGRVLDADILVNANAAYALLDEAAPATTHYDIGAILTHEAGHSLGLDESFMHAEATMWPSVNLGDTHQRTISEDDEQGVIMNYSGTMPLPVAGCGKASVLGRSSHQGGQVLWIGLAVLAAGLWFSRRALRSVPRPALAFGLTGLVLAAPVPASEDNGIEGYAVHGEHAERMRTPAQWISSSTVEARARLEHLLGPDAAKALLVHGTARVMGASMQNGLITTQHSVRDSAGNEHRFGTLGGEVDGIGQLVSDSEPGPVDGEEIVLGTSAHGGTPWAYHRDGLVFGGWLGEGPAIRLER